MNLAFREEVGDVNVGKPLRVHRVEPLQTPVPEKTTEPSKQPGPPALAKSS